MAVVSCLMNQRQEINHLTLIDLNIKYCLFLVIVSDMFVITLKTYDIESFRCTENKITNVLMETHLLQFYCHSEAPLVDRLLQS